MLSQSHTVGSPYRDNMHHQQISRPCKVDQATGLPAVLSISMGRPSSNSCPNLARHTPANKRKELIDLVLRKTKHQYLTYPRRRLCSHLRR